MTKQQFVKILYALLGRGKAREEDTSLFSDMLHDELIRQFVGYLNAHRHFLGYCQIEECHALNDNGVDIILRGESVKIGFQLKSHFDVKEKEFASKVKRQMTESFAHALDLYVILICCPVQEGKPPFSHKISHLLNELSVLHTPYHVAFGPQNAVQYFRGLPPLTRDELLTQKVIEEVCLHDYEKGYEHLPEPKSDEIRRAKEYLDSFGEEWWEEDGGQEAFDRLGELMQKRAAEQFQIEFLPAIPDGIRRRREELIALAQRLLVECRACKSWRERSEYKLPQWLDQVPEEMIPYTSLPNLLSITRELQRYLDIHQAEDAKQSQAKTTEEASQPNVAEPHS